MRARVGIIGGSGLYTMEGFEDVRELYPTTPFGRPSGPLTVGTFDGLGVAFLTRHGQGHRIAPTDINYRANIFALKQLGVEWVISISAVGSMKEKLCPGHMVIPDQFYDHTKHRAGSFFGGTAGAGIVAHVAFADPVCPTLARILESSCQAHHLTVHGGGVYLCIEGPQFSARGESMIYRRWGVDVIGMTNLPEAKLAREAEMCYATLAMVTDYDCWHAGHDDVTVAAVVETLRHNVEHAKGVLRTALAAFPVDRTCLCESALKTAIVTPLPLVPPATKRRLAPLLSRYTGYEPAPKPRRSAGPPARRLSLVPKNQGRKS